MKEGRQRGGRRQSEIGIDERDQTWFAVECVDESKARGGDDDHARRDIRNENAFAVILGSI
ncbi:hypothetical protein D9M72_516660 [compost metagenome]